jgi:hypothetical protein
LEQTAHITSQNLMFCLFHGLFFQLWTSLNEFGAYKVDLTGPPILLWLKKVLKQITQLQHIAQPSRDEIISDACWQLRNALIGTRGCRQCADIPK